jgi:hypothetical protein
MRYPLTLMLLATVTFVTPRTSRAEATDDPAKIRAVARSFMAALYGGDLARAERLAYAGEREREVIEAMALSLSSEAKLAAALDRAFGSCDDNDPCALANVISLLARTDVRMNANNAEVGDPGATTLPMRHTGDGWKVDVIELARRRPTGDGFLARARQRAAAVERVVADVEAGLYVSAADVRAATDQLATAAVETSDVIADE